MRHKHEADTPRGTLTGMRGDRVEIVVVADDGTRTYDVTATRAGRRVEVNTVRGVVEVAEVTRTGEPVRRARFMASRVLALVEHPAEEQRQSAGRRPSEDQLSLGASQPAGEPARPA